MGMHASLGVGVGGCGQVWADMGKSGPGWIRMIGPVWVIWLMGGCGYACRPKGGCGWVWVGAPFSNTW